MHECSKCGKNKPKDCFRSIEETKNDGVFYWCKVCERVESKKRMLKHRYGISYDDYVGMYKDQDERCAICEEEYDLGGCNGLYVDHCHSTGEVRGLLCPRCNSLIGKFLEDENILNKALEYINN